MARDIAPLPRQDDPAPPNLTLFVENAQLRRILAELEQENRVLRAELRDRSLPAP